MPSRKELYESWEVARRACRRLRGERVLDLCAGHGLVPYLMLLLDSRLREAAPTFRVRSAVA